MPRFWTLAAAVALLAVAVAGCGGGASPSRGSGTPPGTSTGSTTPTGPSTGTAGTKFATAKIPGTGTVVVDARGRTVYVLANGKKNLPCPAKDGCSTSWPALALPSGTKAAQAGPGIDASLLGTIKVGGKTYPTYNGYLMYEYTGDSGPGEANGSGNLEAGGTWSALSPSGKPLASSAYGY